MDLASLYSTLDSYYSVDEWWPAESSFEVMVGAILTQQTNWSNVTRVIEDLRRWDLLSPRSMSEVSLETLEELIKPCGFYRQKARYLKNMARYLWMHYPSSVDKLFSKKLDETRSELLALKGIGEETADSILLFAGRKPVFVAATYVSRVLRRTGVMDSDSYSEIQDFVHSELGSDPETYSRLYAMVVELAKEYCLDTPRCSGCPLNDQCSFSVRP